MKQIPTIEVLQQKLSEDQYRDYLAWRSDEINNGLQLIRNMMRVNVASLLKEKLGAEQIVSEMKANHYMYGYYIARLMTAMKEYFRRLAVPEGQTKIEFSEEEYAAEATMVIDTMLLDSIAAQTTVEA